MLNCRKLELASQWSAPEEYLFIEFSDSEQVKTFLPCFFQLAKDKRWEDYLGCFVKKEAFYIAFMKHTGESLQRLLKEESLSVECRLFLIHDILKRLLCWKLPPFLEAGLLKEEAILAADGHAFFDYRQVVPVLQDKGAARTDERLADLLEGMFKGELRRLKPPVLLELLTWLKSDKPRKLPEIYDRWSQCRGLLLQELENDETLLEKWKAGLLSHTELFYGVLKAGITVMAYLALLAGLIAGHKRLLQEEAEKIEEGVKFTQIGAVELLPEEESTKEH